MVFHKGDIGNPRGIGGFRDHPESINTHGSPHGKGSITVNLRRFMEMTNDELNDYVAHTDLTNAEVAAANMIIMSRQQNRAGMQAIAEITDRTEGKAPMTVYQPDIEPATVHIEFKGRRNHKKGSKK